MNIVVTIAVQCFWEIFLVDHLTNRSCQRIQRVLLSSPGEVIAIRFIIFLSCFFLFPLSCLSKLLSSTEINSYFCTRKLRPSDILKMFWKSKCQGVYLSFYFFSRRWLYQERLSTIVSCHEPVFGINNKVYRCLRRLQKEENITLIHYILVGFGGCIFLYWFYVCFYILHRFLWSFEDTLCLL